MKDKKPWSFCETPEEKCTMNYCDENGCQNRKRNYVQGNDIIADAVGQSEQFNCLGGNYAKGIKPCEEWCGEDMCQKPSN